jgi:RHS repeat-associated protein
MQIRETISGNNSGETGIRSPPAISLPKGGGAIRGIGEKLAANPVTGTSSMTVPIATSPGRSGFGPQLALSYDSGSGNGPFGLGWSLGLPQITRKTDKGLPRYDDREGEESDVFVLSGAEDLVPVENLPNRTVNGATYAIRRYRPRIEGLFARIERWTNTTKAEEVFWRSVSRDNITTWYGRTAESRIVNPLAGVQIFSWLICQSHDDKGNVLVYGYKAEDGAGIDLTQAHEWNRGERDNPRRSAQRYLKHVRYGNHSSYFPELKADALWPEPLGATASDASEQWCFEVVFDYGEHDSSAPSPKDTGVWPVRNDPFSTYRAGFEVRTYRLCQRVLIFHHFPNESGVGADCLVRSIDFTYSYEENFTDARNPIFSFLVSVSQSGYKRQQDATYLKKSLPPVEFTYTEATIQEDIREVEAESLENLPYGLDGSQYQWVDLDGEGLSGILTEQAEAWFYKRNLSPIHVVKTNGSERIEARFAPVELADTKPALSLGSGHAQFLDLAGDGQLDLVTLRGPTPGFYERTQDEGWEPLTPFGSLPTLDWDGPNLKFVDLTGDGHADILVSEDNAFFWHPSLAEAGFGPREISYQSRDEESGPKLVFADGTQSAYLADMSGDGLTDLVRIRNGEVCYWPNLGYGRFGAKVTMDNAPWFDSPDLFDQRRIRLADIDGSGITDILYLSSNGVRVYFNKSGNSWSQPRTLQGFPRIDNLASVTALDLLGNGTACLVWSSPLSGDAARSMRYIDLMGGQKPHLLIKTVNNLGAETVVSYAPSTKFYLQDKLAGRAWLTRLPFPVHVVERVETYDRISQNRFVSCYTYHHGYFDGEEREFRGFGLVEQTDTEEIGDIPADAISSETTNLDAASFVPPIHTKTWFHTGAYLEEEAISLHLAHEYFGSPPQDDPDFEAKFNAFKKQSLLDDTILPHGLTAEEQRDACRALKGAILRQEVYANDAPKGASEEIVTRSKTPYTVTEKNFTIEQLQPRGQNQHAVFFTHSRETLSYYYERNPDDPRIGHAITLEVDKYGNVLKSVAIGYGRKQSPLPEQADREKQTQTLITYTENEVTIPIDAAGQPDEYRTPLPAEARTYELTGYTLANAAQRFQIPDFVQPDPSDPDGRKQTHIFDSEPSYEELATAGRQRRLIERGRMVYRRNDLTALLPLGQVESLALPGESYKLAFTPGLLTQIYRRPLSAVSPNSPPPEALLPSDVASLLGSTDSDGGSYVDLDGDGHWWIPPGRIFFSTMANVINPASTAAAELIEARQHFFLSRKFTDPFGHSSTVDYDTHDLLVVKTEDALQNTATALHDYRVLQPRQLTDPNGNRSEAAFDALGMVVAMAVRGKAGQDLGDLLEGFDADPPLADLQSFVANPQDQAAALLGKATTRIVYDLDRFWRCGQAPFASTLARETHFFDPGGAQTKIQISFSYSDGFGREIQKKIQAEAGDAPQREANVALPTGDIRPGELVVDTNGKPVEANAARRWVGTGRTVFNNKGKPVRQYEPFFSTTHLYEEEGEMTDTGVTSVLFYDPAERVVATLHPNHTWEKVVFDPWQQTTDDVNDTVLNADGSTDPKLDEDVAGFFSRLPEEDYLPTWLEQRIVLPANDPERVAADKAVVHRQTPTIAHFDTLGRPFLTIAHNRFERDDVVIEEKYPSRIELDIEGNQRTVRDAIVQIGDALGRIVMRYDYDMLGNRIHQASMEAGERWMLNDVIGKPIRAWDSRGFIRRLTYDELRRPTELFVTENGVERLAERTVYGESQGAATNHRTRVFQVFDAAGVVTSEEYDFKGNLLHGKRELLSDYKSEVDWQQNPIANDGTFTSISTFDALNRPLSVTAPDNSTYRPTYNEANLLDKVDVSLRGAADATFFVTNINYNAKGQRELIAYGNGAQTTYEYDPLTFRLTKLRTTRAAGLNGLASQLLKSAATLQDLHYTYDPAGNITRIEDAALLTIFHNNEQVEPVCDYSYDAIYRLIEANGREHIGQTAHDFNPQNRRDYDFAGFVDFMAHPNDLQAMRRYTERYEYDAVGNFHLMQHIANVGGWTRGYEYAAASLLEPSEQSNRLTKTTVGNGFTASETYTYTDAQGNDIQGCMTAMNAMQMEWNCKDQLQKVNLGGGGTAYYIYGAGGQRVRKVVETQNGTLSKERLYLGGFEIYRKFGTSALVRETLHITDDKQCIALVETKTHEFGSEISNPQPVVRYQLGNHLGSASLELDEGGGLISYEEYHPYGTTAFQTMNSTAEVPLKRYRYTGKERDEESGLYYHGARYYAPWLARWTAADPIGVGGGMNVYAHVRGNPLSFADPDGTDVGPKSVERQQREVEQLAEVNSAKYQKWQEHAIEESAAAADIEDNRKQYAPDDVPENGTVQFDPKIGPTMYNYNADLDADYDDSSWFGRTFIYGMRPSEQEANLRSAQASNATMDPLKRELWQGVINLSIAYQSGFFDSFFGLGTTGTNPQGERDIKGTSLTSTGTGVTEAESLAPLNAEKLGGQRVFLVGPEGASSTRAIRVRGNLVTYDTRAPGNQGRVRADMQAIANSLGFGGANSAFQGTWLTGTHGNPEGQFGGDLRKPEFFKQERGYGRYYGWDVKDVGQHSDPSMLPGGSQPPNPTVYSWCYSSAVPAP